MIRFTTLEIKIDKEMIIILIPSRMCLFQTIERIIESTYKSGVYHKTMRFLHIIFFSEISMKKCTFHVHLVNIATKMSSKRNDQSDIIHLYDKRNGLSIVDAFLLRESLEYQMNLVAFNNTIEGKLGLIYPLTLQHILSLKSRNKFPHLILLQGINFRSHSSFPFWYSISIIICVWIKIFKNMFH